MTALALRCSCGAVWQPLARVVGRPVGGLPAYGGESGTTPR